MSSTSRTSVLRRLDEIYNDIRQTYLKYDYPWVIGYSGGKIVRRRFNYVGTP